MRSTITRPEAEWTVAESCSIRGTMALRSRTRTWPPGTGRDCSSGGIRNPSLVWNVTSTTASTGNGLNTASSSRASRLVVPVGKYHVSDDADAHGLLLVCVPVVLVTRRSTAMLGSLVSTTADANGDT